MSSSRLLEQQVAAWMREHPGQHTAHDMARALGHVAWTGRVSNANVRRALHRLEACGQVRGVPGRSLTGVACTKWEGTWEPGPMDRSVS